MRKYHSSLNPSPASILEHWTKDGSSLALHGAPRSTTTAIWSHLLATMGETLTWSLYSLAPSNSGKSWKSGFFAFENSKLQNGRKDALNLGKCQALTNVELNHQKKLEFDSTNLRSNLIYVVYFKSFPDARWFSPNHRFSLQKHFSTSNKKHLAIATKMQYDLGLLRSNSQFHSHPRKLKLFFMGGRARQNIATAVDFFVKQTNI